MGTFCRVNFTEGVIDIVLSVADGQVFLAIVFAFG